MGISVSGVGILGYEILDLSGDLRTSLAILTLVDDDGLCGFLIVGVFFEIVKCLWIRVENRKLNQESK